ncbi:MAG: YceI family protein [Bacteroidetes bacterium]|nr:YceI family protein [Bacteroidota bacterium]
MRSLLLALSVPGFLFAQTKTPIDKARSSITYSMKHTLHAWDGTSKGLNGVVVLGADNKVEKVAITTKVADFDSENSNRDAHMLEVVEALKYPNISFYSTSITETKKGELDVKGVLQFHGINKQLSFKANIIHTKNNVQVNGNFIFLLEDFKIDRPSFMLKKVENKVNVKFDVFY